jgi:L-ectoine synthase
MIVRTLEEIRGTEREVHAENWVSFRLLLKDDGMGFSFHETHIYPGTQTEMRYTNHLESVYCIEGEGEIVDLKNNRAHPIGPGTLYILNEHDHHVVKATTLLRLMCVFNPPVTGQEVHDESGTYPLVADVAEE